MTLKIFHRYLNDEELTFTVSNDAVVIGRQQPDSRSVDLDLSPDLRVSRLHAYLFSDNGMWWVRDLKSKHGTYYNGQLIKTQTPLSSGCQVQIGDTVLRFEFPDDAFETIGTHEGSIIAEMTIDTSSQNDDEFSETERIDILAKISKLERTYQGTAVLEALVREIVTMLPKAQRAEIILYQDKELIPVAYFPSEKSYVSFTLAKRAIIESSAFIWERNSASSVSPIIESLDDTITALYVPIVYNRQLVGVIHADSTVIGTLFTKKDMQLIGEIAFAAAPLLTKGEIAKAVPSAFISYSHEDRKFVNRLVGDLRRKGVRVWFDERLRAGQDWEMQLNIAIESTRAFLLVMTPSSMKSSYVQSEIKYAQNNQKTILPILHQQCALPESIGKIQYIEFLEQYDKGLSDLLQELNRLDA